MRVLLTGHRGFTGRYLINALAASGHEMLPLHADVTNRTAVAIEVAAARPQAVIHLAADAFVQSDDITRFYQVNQIGTFHLLEALASSARGIPVLLASSANIYGTSVSGYVNEDIQCNPTNHYASSKLAMEIGARLWSDCFATTVVRPFNYTGRGQDERYLIAKIVAHFRRRAPFIELGNLEIARDFGDVRTVVNAYVGLLEGVHTGTYNIATGKVHSIREVLAICREITGHAIEIRVNPALVRLNDIALLGGDPTRLRSALPNWEPLALYDTLEWMLEP